MRVYGHPFVHACVHGLGCRFQPADNPYVIVFAVLGLGFFVEGVVATLLGRG